VEPKREQNAKKETIAAAEAIDMARKVSEIRATKGRKVVRLAVKGATDEEIAALVVGPSGNLRAPALRLGKTLVVGFDEEMYAELIS
jgi:arsenate reductase-like glutaredoxin family protein